MERLFNLDPQLIHDAVLLALAVFVMFTFRPICCLIRQEIS
ncbi:MAG: hypothetical protein ACLSHV_08865 [Hominisplanchenecus sp.]